MDSKELAAVRNWTRGVTPQELLEHIDILEGCISILQQENARLKATHEAELGVCEGECEVVVELKAGVQRWTEEAARYCKNADYWRERTEKLCVAARDVLDMLPYKGLLDVPELRSAVEGEVEKEISTPEGVESIYDKLSNVGGQ